MACNYDHFVPVLFQLFEIQTKPVPASSAIRATPGLRSALPLLRSFGRPLGGLAGRFRCGRLFPSIDGGCVAQIQRERVWAGLELHGLTPGEALVVVARGDHQIVDSRGHAGKGSAAVSVGPDR